MELVKLISAYIQSLELFNLAQSLEKQLGIDQR
jgi:hypothetical protein